MPLAIGRFGNSGFPAAPVSKTDYSSVSLPNGYPYATTFPAGYSVGTQNPPVLSSFRDVQPPSSIVPRLAPSTSEVAASTGELDVDMDDSSSDLSDERAPLPKTDLPFDDTKMKCPVYDREGLNVPVEISCRFMKQYNEDKDCWIFYRRNYFAVTCSYSFKPPGPITGGRIYLSRPSDPCGQPILAFAMRIRGVINAENGKEMEIVVFNTKRRSIGKPEMRKMKPNMPGYSRVYAKSTGDCLNNSHAQNSYTPPPNNFTFLRNQFRLATQNNGRRRKEQDYYHIIVELMAEVEVAGTLSRDWVKIASRISGPILTRGRCPQSFESFDPSNPDHGRRKPRRVDHRGRRNGRRHSSFKKEGRSGTANNCTSPEPRNRSPTTGVGSQRSCHRLPSLMIGSSLPGLTRMSNSLISTTIPMSPISSSGIDSPDEDNIPLPKTDDFHLMATRYSSDDERPDDDNDLINGWTQQQTDAGRREMTLLAHHLSGYGFEFDISDTNAPGYSTKSITGGADGSTTWERLEGHFI